MTPGNENSTEARTCEACGQPFVHEEADLQMYESLDVPPAEECPRCRLRHLFALWNFGIFRKGVSALSGKSIITPFPESVPFPLYSRSEWVSDAWDPLSYGTDYDPSKPFLEQFQALRAAVPHPHQTGVNNINSDWSDDVWSCKNCYLCRSLLECEDLSYVYRVVRCKNSIDLVYTFESERCYACLDCFKCYELRYSANCSDCIQSAFLYDCRNVQNCFMCWNLRNKQYCIRNQQYSKEEYLQKIKEFDLRSHSAVEKLKAEFNSLVANEAVHRQDLNLQTQNSFGNFLTECRNCYDCAFLEKSENCRHCWRGIYSKDSIDCAGSFSERSTGLVNTIHAYEVISTLQSSEVRYSAYLDACEECEYCFGCVGLRKKKYCVLNKQYSREEYETLVAKIKSDMRERKEWGRYLPMSLADMGYNVSNAHLTFPESKEAVAALGGVWHDFPDETPEGMNAEELPDRVDDAPDSITKQALICPETKRRYNIAPHELAFYRQHGIPLPRRHFDRRIMESFKRMALATTPKKGRCTFCSRDITHFFQPELGYQKISCVECYQREIV